MCDIERDDETGAPRIGITDFVDELTVALTASRLYEKGHPRVQSSIASLLSCVEALAQENASEPLVLGSAEGVLFYQRKPLLRASLSSARLIGGLKGCRAGGISIAREAGQDDLIALVELLATNKLDFPGVQQANGELARRGSRFVEFLPEYVGGTPDLAAAQGAAAPEIRALAPEQPKIGLDVPLELYQRTVTLLQDCAERVCHGDLLELDRARGFVEAILTRLSQDASSMMGLARYERYDAYTFGHSIRVSFLALNFARTLFEREDLLLRVGLAALLHDIGKARVPFEVLHSTAKLTSEERIEMNKHTTYGGEILLGLPDVDPLAVSIAFGHHQWPDGGGYPSTIHPVRQSIGTRIIKICDVYEALTAVRPYKPRMSPARAYRVMFSMRNQFDPVLLRRFMHVNGIYPVGSLVKLSSGETARVVQQSRDPMSPVVRLEADDLGAPIGRGESLVRDLSEKLDGAPRVGEMLQDAA